MAIYNSNHYVFMYHVYHVYGTPFCGYPLVMTNIAIENGHL